MEPVSFFIINFPNFHSHPITSVELVLYYMNFHLNRPLWPKHSIGRTMHSTYFKIRPSIYLFKASIALEPSASILVFSWSVVSYQHSNTQQLCAPVFHSCGTSPCTSLMRYPTPSANIHLYPTTWGLKLLIFISFYGPETTHLLPILNQFFCCLYCSSQVLGLLSSYPGLCGGFQTIQEA